MACDNKNECTCTFSCGNRKKCCECVAYHRRLGEIPGCFFSKQAEKTGDRSVENLYSDQKNS